jgi:hypothetical protein
VFLHYEKNGKNFLKARLNDGDWNVLEVKSRSDGDSKMAEIRDNWKSSISLGLLPTNSDFYANDLRTFGFGELDFSKISSDFNENFVFTLGREIDEKLKNGWFPSSESEIKNENNMKLTVEQKMELFLEKNCPTDPAKWSASKAAAKKKFDVYPSAYANGWAAKNYKAKGGGWKTAK